MLVLKRTAGVTASSRRCTPSPGGWRKAAAARWTRSSRRKRRCSSCTVSSSSGGSRSVHTWCTWKAGWSPRTTHPAHPHDVTETSWSSDCFCPLVHSGHSPFWLTAILGDALGCSPAASSPSEECWTVGGEVRSFARALSSARAPDSTCASSAAPRPPADSRSCLQSPVWRAGWPLRPDPSPSQPVCIWVGGGERVNRNLWVNKNLRKTNTAGRRCALKLKLKHKHGEKKKKESEDGNPTRTTTERRWSRLRLFIVLLA